jgi:hypothetical protein
LRPDRGTSAAMAPPTANLHRAAPPTAGVTNAAAERDRPARALRAPRLEVGSDGMDDQIGLAVRGLSGVGWLGGWPVVKEDDTPRPSLQRLSG